MVVSSRGFREDVKCDLGLEWKEGLMKGMGGGV